MLDTVRLMVATLIILGIAWWCTGVRDASAWERLSVLVADILEKAHEH
jgi:hypothetical protein